MECCRSSTEATIQQYKNYLSGKLLSEHKQVITAASIELTCKGRPARSEATLADVWKELWGQSENDLELFYSTRI
jgi:hypothetical protein